MFGIGIILDTSDQSLSFEIINIYLGGYILGSKSLTNIFLGRRKNIKDFMENDTGVSAYNSPTTVCVVHITKLSVELNPSSF